MKLLFRRAVDADAAPIAEIHTAVATALTAIHGSGHWSFYPTAKSVARDIRGSYILTACIAAEIVGTLRLATKKPWAIDAAYFTPVPRPLYLTGMAVQPTHQRRGIGSSLLAEAKRIGAAWPAQSIRLDAYDAAAGAGPFYAANGFRETGRVSYRSNPLIYFELLL